MARTYRYTDSRDIAVDPLVAWDVVSNHEQMAEWMPARKVILEQDGTPNRNGVGAVRAIHLFGSPIRERITAFEAPTKLRYELVSGLPFRDYVGQITVAPVAGGTRMTTEISFRTVIPGSQFIVAVALRVASAGAVRAARRRAG
ncbi:hypothetical protein A5733_02340 [Mycobacterium sp. NS-7484]|uniref:SRPBCC family protein n=1 Tax=Mycobacterium sp. NS-7484 TaxID=1834161 RepID=UPI00096EC478|nr:SRPBCC family protein [Mycobacterium sp. NS-7484]OMC02497.1 hypothetical protein A5733_02340 [Mycobacterium sp. NS-7484]